MPNFSFLADRNLAVSVLEVDALEINLLLEAVPLIQRELRLKRERIYDSAEVGRRHAAAIIMADEETVAALAVRLEKAKRDAVNLRDSQSEKADLFRTVGAGKAAA